MKPLQVIGGMDMDDMFTTSYRIDSDDCIYAVGGVWQTLDEQNQSADMCGLASLNGKSVFKQFGDDETRMIYAKIFERVRVSGKAVYFQIHCDELQLIRMLEARILPLAHAHLEVGFRVLKEQPRDASVILDVCGVEQPFITMCSYCGDLKDRDGKWQALEREITSSDLFSGESLPKISHGMCPDCAENFLADILTLPEAA